MRRTHAALGLLCLAFIAQLALFRSSLIDDAFISYRYAEHLVQGHGLCFNVGERVEGYTNFLFVVLIAGALRLGLSAPPASQLLGAAGGLLAIVALYSLGRPRHSAWLAPLFLAINPAFAMWCVHGLETGLFAGLVTLGLLLALGEIEREKPPIGSSLALVLGALTRPEGVLVFAALTAMRILLHRPLRDRRGRVVSSVGLFTAAYLPYFFWRWRYYGGFMPHMFYVKGDTVQAAAGLRYVGNFAWKSCGLLLCPLIDAWWSRPDRIDPAHRARAQLLGGVAAVYTGYVVFVGGDAFPAFRFFMPILPILCLSAAMLLADAIGRIDAPRARAVMLAVAVVAAGGVWGETRREAAGAREFVARMHAVAGWLKANAPPDTSIALNPVGVVPYETGLRTIDMLGLTDAQIGRGRRVPWEWIAHQKGDGAYVLSRRPSYILLRNVWLEPGRIEDARELYFQSERELAADPRFAAWYEPVNVRIDDRYFGFYRLKGAR
jgi:hypothetical protein